MSRSRSPLSFLFPRRPRPERRREGRPPLRLEALEERSLLAVTAISASDPNLIAGTPGGENLGNSVSNDGRYVVYISNAINAVDGQVESVLAKNVFVYDRALKQTTLVSHRFDSLTTTAKGVSDSGVISGDATTVAFVSTATDLVAGMPNSGNRNVFVYDFASKTVSLASGLPASLTGAPLTVGGNGDSGDLTVTSATNPTTGKVAINNDGGVVAYLSNSTNLVTGQSAGTGSGTQVFAYNPHTRTNTLISHFKSSPTTVSNQESNGSAFTVALSTDGTTIVYTSTATDSADGTVTKHDTGGPDVPLDVFVNVRGATIPDSTLLVSRGAYTTTSGNFDTADRPVNVEMNFGGFVISMPPVISSDGTYIAYTSRASDGLGLPVFPDPMTPLFGMKVFLFHWTDGAAQLVSHNDNRGLVLPRDNLLLDRVVTKLSYDSFQPSISADGRFVAFLSLAQDVLPGLTGFNPMAPGQDLFLFDRTRPRLGGGMTATVLVDHQIGSLTAVLNRPFPLDYPAYCPVVSSDGRNVAYLDDAPDVIPGFSGSFGGHLFLFDRTTDLNVLVDHVEVPATSLTTGAERVVTTVPQPEVPILFAGGGSSLIFTTDALDQSADPTNLLNGYTNVFTYDIDTAHVSIDSVRAPSLPSVTAGGSSLLTATPASLPRPADGTVVTGTTGSNVSADGRFYVYTSSAANLVPGQNDHNYSSDVFLYDRVDQKTTLVSHRFDSMTRTANGPSLLPTISADGSTVAFVSLATTLISNYILSSPPFNTFEVYVWNRASGESTLASHSNSDLRKGSAGPADSLSISADGRYLAYHSLANNVVVGENVPGSPNGNVYLYDRDSQALSTSAVLVSHNSQAVLTAGLGSATSPVISADGNWVAYVSNATDAVTNQTGPVHQNVYLYDRVKGAASVGATTLVSLSGGTAATTGNGDSDSPSISADGQSLAFRSDATDLISGATTGKDVFVARRSLNAAQQTVTVNALVSHAANDFLTHANATSDSPTISPDGRFVAFRSLATNLVPAQSGAPRVSNVFLASVGVAGVPIALVSGQKGSSAVTAGGNSDSPAISSDDRYVAFSSTATDLVDGQTNPGVATRNVFLFDTQATTSAVPAPQVRLVSGSSGSLTKAGNGDSTAPEVVGSGPTKYVVFNSDAYDLIPGDYNSSTDVFLHQINVAPVALMLSNTSVPDRSPAPVRVGVFSTIDTNPNPTFTYSLVSGAGSTDNVFFTISGNVLMLNVAPNFATKPSYSIRVRVTNAGGLSFEQTFTITVTPVALPITDLTLSRNAVQEQSPVGTSVGLFTTTDPNPNSTAFTYTLVPGPGGADNAAFTISGNTLQTAAVFQFSTRSSYSIRVRTTDLLGVSFEKSFVISVTQILRAPNDLLLSNASVPELHPAGTTVGVFSTADPNFGAAPFTYALVPGAGGDDNGSFTVSGNTLQTAAVFDHGVRSSYSVRVRTTDALGKSLEKAFTVVVSPFNVAPNGLALSKASFPESSPVGTAVGTFTATDPNAGDTFTYSLVPGAGAADNASFTISGNTLLTATPFKATTQSVYGIRVRVTDAGGLFFEMNFTLNVIPNPKPPPHLGQTVGAFDPNTATWYLRNSNGAGAPDAGAFQYGGAGWVPLVGDWGGTGQVSVGAFDPNTGTWYLRNSDGPGAPDIAPFQFGLPNWFPVVGDWTGSGHTGIGIVDPGSGTWYLRNSAGPGNPDFAPFVYGLPNWTPVTGDWGGTGRTGIGTIDPTAFTWYLRNAAGAGAPDVAPFAYGLAGWKAVTGDWTGSGHTGVGVVDPVGYWYLRNTPSAGGPNVLPFAYGLGGWTPLSGDWDFPASPQLAAGGTSAAGADAAALTQGELDAAVAAALARLQAAGASPALLARLGSASYAAAALPGAYLGLTDAAQGQVWVNSSAAGYGWFAGASAASDGLFDGSGQARPGAAAGGKMDLLTVVLHEMGHLAGRPDVDPQAHPGDLMADALPAGARRVDALDAVFNYGFPTSS